MISVNFYFVFVITISVAVTIGKCNLNLPKAIEPKIVGGQDATHNGTKHLVSIRLKAGERFFGDGHICGGSLINSKTVLTAAHCLLNLEIPGVIYWRSSDEFTVVMGTLDRTKKTIDTFQTNVKYITPHKNFNVETLANDIAIMILKNAVPLDRYPQIVPMQLANNSIAEGTVCRIDGWGKTRQSNNVIPNRLQTANVSVLNRQRCNENYHGRLTAGSFCAGHWKGGIDSCQGDSGGPLSCNGTLVGVVSWGDNCASPNLPGIYSDVNYFRQWILTNNANNALSLRYFYIILITCIIKYL